MDGREEENVSEETVAPAPLPAGYLAPRLNSPRRYEKPPARVPALRKVARRSRREAADQQKRLIVELEAVLAEAGDQGGVNVGEGFVAVFLKFGLQALDAEFFAGGVRAFHKAVGVKREQAAGLGFDRGAGEVTFGQNSEGHIRRLVLHNFVGPRGKMQNRRMAGDAEAQAFAGFRQEAKCDE